MTDSFLMIAKESYPKHSVEDQEFAANAMRVWFGYEKPKTVSKWQKMHATVDKWKKFALHLINKVLEYSI